LQKIDDLSGSSANLTDKGNTGSRILENSDMVVDEEEDEQYIAVEA